MTDAVHYLPVSFGYQHFVRPLVQGEFANDKAVLLAPEDTHWQRQIDKARSFLEDEAGITVTDRTVETDSFASIVAAGYDDIRDDLASGADVYINTTSSPWALGHGYATAASYLLAETPLTDDDEESLKVGREKVTLYHTEPADYRVDELLAVAKQTQELRETFQAVQQDADQLRSDVEQDRETVEALVDLLKMHESGEASLTETLDMFEGPMEAAGLETVGEGMRDILEGIELVTDGINTLSETENQAALQMLQQFGGSGGIGSVVTGLQDLAERPETDTTDITLVDLFEYLDTRLGRVHTVLQRVEMRYDEVEADFERTPPEMADFLSDVEASGIADGVQTFDGNPYEELPGPLQFGLRPGQRAILSVLAEGGSAESIQGLTVRVATEAVAVADHLNIEIPMDPAVEALANGDADADDPFVADHVFPRIKSRIQNDLDGLVDAGFTKKTRDFGRTVGVKLTPAGEAYCQARDFDDEWRTISFAELSQKVADAASEYTETLS